MALGERLHSLAIQQQRTAGLKGDHPNAGGGAVAVKVAKENHDLRFDIPCLGERTLETCASAGIRVIAFEAGRTLLLDRETVEALAQRHRITVTAV